MNRLNCKPYRQNNKGRYVVRWILPRQLIRDSAFESCPRPFEGQARRSLTSNRLRKLLLRFKITYFSTKERVCVALFAP
jgi:hypothetical protein